MLTCWTQQTQPSPTFIQHIHSSNGFQLFHQVLSFENSHWAGLGRILGRCLCNHKQKICVQCLLFPISVGRFSLAKTAKNHLHRNQGCCPEMASFSAQLTSQDVGMCWHMFAILSSTFSTFHSGNGFMSCQGVRGWKRTHWTNLGTNLDNKGKLSNPRSISLGTLWLAKCAAQLPSLNLLNRLCLSNSDADVQSVGYNSAQSPTNWQLIHGKDPSILCWLSSRLFHCTVMKNPKGEIQAFALIQENL